MSILKKAPFILVILALLVAQAAILAPPAYAAVLGKVAATEVEEDKTVTIQGTGLRVNSRYNVFLSKGKNASGGVRVGFAVTDSNGSFTKTFRIPGRLVDVAKINISIENNRGDTATNWFINASAEGNTGGTGAPDFSFRVTANKRDDWVRIRTSNLPANVTFDVRMGRAGSEGANGTVVGTLRATEGGNVRAEFEIPDSLDGRKEIDIRVENRGLGIAYSVTFDNK
jgi:hypothetical protein